VQVANSVGFFHTRDRDRNHIDYMIALGVETPYFYEAQACFEASYVDGMKLGRWSYFKQVQNMLDANVNITYKNLSLGAATAIDFNKYWENEWTEN
jgi:hypothetical protein